MMVIIVRHGTGFIVTAESKENVKIMLGNIYTSVFARLVRPIVFLYNDSSPLRTPSGGYPTPLFSGFFFVFLSFLPVLLPK